MKTITITDIYLSSCILRKEGKDVIVQAFYSYKDDKGDLIFQDKSYTFSPTDFSTDKATYINEFFEEMRKHILEFEKI